MATEMRRFECPICQIQTPHAYRASFSPSLGRMVVAWTCSLCGQINPEQTTRPGPNERPPGDADAGGPACGQDRDGPYR